MPRVYFNCSGAQLQDVYEKSSNDTKVLKLLLDELQHRSTSKMQSLCREVEKTLDNINSQNKSTVPKDGNKANIKKANPSARKESDKKAKDPEMKDPVSSEKNIRKRVADKTANFEAEKQVVQHTLLKEYCTGTIRAPGNISGVPEKRIFKLKNDVKLNLQPDMPLVKRYEAALKALITDMRRKGTYSRQLSLENGIRTELDYREIGYKFPYDGEADLFEGARVLIFIAGMETSGRILAVLEQHLIISLASDFGSRIAACILRVDNTAMLEALKDRMEKIEQGEVQGFNSKLAEAVARPVENEVLGKKDIVIEHKQFFYLNPQQNKAVNCMMAGSVKIFAHICGWASVLESDSFGHSIG